MLTCTHFCLAPADVEGNAETATVVDLVPWTEYEFRVIATNTLGTGEPSSPSPKDRTLEAGNIVSWLLHTIYRLWSQRNFKMWWKCGAAVQLSILIFIHHHFIIALFTYVKYCCRNESAHIPSCCASYSRNMLPSSPHKPLQMSTLLKLYTEIQL